jgi:hypothetical protein
VRLKELTGKRVQPEVFKSVRTVQDVVDANVLLPLKLYPVLVNAVLLSVFAYSLISPPSMIERFARIRKPNLHKMHTTLFFGMLLRLPMLIARHRRAR